MLRREHQREAANQLGIGNIITTMRLISASDWPVFVEQVSVVERILQEDPAGAYAHMDFPTRDRYRHSVEQLARGAKKEEPDVARRAVALAREGRASDPGNDRRHHVGYYLISRGRFRLEQDLGYPPTTGERVARFLFRHPALGYLGTMASSIALILATFISYAARNGASWPELLLVGVVALLPVSELAINLLNLLITTHVPPRQLPKLDMRAGIPASDRTMVVVPAIIDTPAHVESLVDDLEVRFFANRDPHLHFALLTDFRDASEREAPEDAALLTATKTAIESLNRRHGTDRFYLFHRTRSYNASERCWMGWERKRGKLHEFNRLLRGATDTSFAVQIGDSRVLPSVKYVITLDSDTQLPLETGRAMVGTLSHPLNRPRFDPTRAARHRGLRHSPAQGRGQHRQRQPHAVFTDLLRPRRHRSRTPPRCRTSIRTCSTRAATSARASTTSTPSRSRSADASPTTRCSATTCSRDRSRARRSAPTSTSSTTIRITI